MVLEVRTNRDNHYTVEITGQVDYVTATKHKLEKEIKMIAYDKKEYNQPGA